MSFGDFQTTRSGRELLAQAMAGGTLTITEIQIGDGAITTEDINALTGLIAPVHTVSIAAKEVRQGQDGAGNTVNYCMVRGDFKVTDLEKSFYFREIGVMAKVDDGEEALLCYNNAYELADYLDKAGTETQDRTLMIPVFIGQVANLQVIVNVDLTYVTQEEFEEHTGDMENPHGVTAEQTGAVPLDGSVPMTGTLQKQVDGVNYDYYGAFANDIIAPAIGTLKAMGNNPDPTNHFSQFGRILPSHPYADLFPSYYGMYVAFRSKHVSNDSYTLHFYVKNDVLYYQQTSDNDVITKENWIKLAKASDYLPLTGGTLTGNLVLGNGTGAIMSGRYGNDMATNIVIYYNNTSFRTLYISDSGDIARSVVFGQNENGVAVGGYLYGDHNKPSGTYTGNGSATSRTIAIGGIGNVLMITSASYIGFVTKDGGYFYALASGGNQYAYTFKSNYIKFENGVLTIAHSVAYFNANGTEYTYQLL